MVLLSFGVVADKDGKFGEQCLIRNEVESMGSEMDIYYIDKMAAEAETILFQPEDSELLVGDKRYHLENVEGFFVFPPDRELNIVAQNITDDMYDLKLSEMVSLVEGILYYFDDCDSTTTINNHSNLYDELYFLLNSGEICINHPDTLISTNQEDIESFIDKHEAVTIHPVNLPDKKVQTDNLDVVKREIESGVVAKEYIRGTRYRTYIVDGSTVGGIKIDNEELLYNHYGRDIGWSETDLPTKIISASETVAEKLEMNIGKLEFVLNERDVFIIPANHSFHFLEFEKHGVKVSRAIAGYLVGREY